MPPQFQVLLPPKPIPAKIEYEENELAAEILQKVRSESYFALIVTSRPLQILHFNA